jgi:dsDNA-binding SOS-regulon protein
MKLPKIDLKELKKLKEDNFKERLDFIDQYTEWLKKSPNKKWSSQQSNLIQ